MTAVIAGRRLAGARLHAQAEGAPVADLCYSANTGRVHQAHRVSIRGTSAADFEGGLSALLQQAPHPSVMRSFAPGPTPVIAFLFTGQGAQYHGMARGLYENSPVFRGVIEQLTKGNKCHGDS